jgi:hypothetical protein
MKHNLINTQDIFKTVWPAIAQAPLPNPPVSISPHTQGINFSGKYTQKCSACLRTTTVNHKFSNTKWFQSIYPHIQGHTVDVQHTIILHTPCDHNQVDETFNR